MADEHNPHVVGCYGNEVVKTPNIDALAARGTRFENAYCNVPICVPSRASVATGRYAHEIGSWDNAKPYVGTEAPSWGHRLTSQHHKVTTIGKLHYRRVNDPSGFPDQRLPMHVLNGVGDLYGTLRGRMPPPKPTRGSRHTILNAGVGEPEYVRYDRAIARESARWLKEEAPKQDKPWALFVSFATPHFPLLSPREYFDMYPREILPLPIRAAPDEWPRHPAIELHRNQAGYEEPFEEKTLRTALAAYYGLVSFVDEQVGLVLRALEDAGLTENTRIIYTSDHGDSAGEQGLWKKSSMYEGSVGVPMILAGPDVPEGRVVRTNVSLVDCFPSIVEAVGAEPAPEDSDLPGGSLWRIAREGDHQRVVFAEYHAIYSDSAMFMIRDERYKYVHYVGRTLQLFDMQNDPGESQDLAGDPNHTDVLANCERLLRSIVDPEQVDRRAKSDQRRRIEAAGGVASVAASGDKIPYTPAPPEFR
jgi:choline-sulfatase